LLSDALDAIDWLSLRMEDATVNVSRHDTLESGPATRLDIILSTGDRAALWVHGETGLPSKVELHSAVWGEATFTTRSIGTLERPHPDLFIPSQKEE
jgi:hypothetical protein